jgi:glycosyltransferase involved in cell wall biosynthesis
LKGIAPVVATLNNYFPLCPIDYTKNNLVESGDFSFFNMVKSIYKTREGSFVGRFFSAIFYTVYNRITLPFSRRIDNYIVYADSIKEIYLKGKFDRDKFYRVSNLIKFDKLVSNKSREKNVLLFVGDFSYAKGFRELVEALMLLKDKDVKLWVAGSGNGEEYFKDFTKKNKLNIKFYGWVDKEKTKKLYQSASLLIHPSQWPEPFSRVWLEAINNEIPIISSDNPCALEILKDCAVFYHRGHPEELRDKIKEALNSKKRINFKKVKNGLDFDKTIDRLIYVYNKIKRDKK